MSLIWYNGGNILRKMKFIALMSILACLLIVIPAGFAADNETALGLNDTGDVIGADYYFDANVENDTGNGSYESPYKELTAERIYDNSTLHLNDGEYDFHYDNKVINNVSIVGNDPQKTVISNAYFTVNSSFTLLNVTLKNSVIENQGNFTAINSLFNESSSQDLGGVINSNNYTYFDNCTFADNFAQYGGAIHISKGILIIKNSQFINNEAEFFGGAIISLNSTLNINNVTFRDNKARFDGGSIYCLDGIISLVNSSFINNSGKNGGALLVDVSRSTFLESNKFINNTASDCAGAFSLMYNDNITINSNYYENNKANEYCDDYVSDFFQIFIGDNNYSMFVYRDISTEDVPDYYSLVDENCVTPVKNQGSSGSCWSFATLAVLESCIKKAEGLEFDFSENNMKNLMTSYSYYGYTQLDANGGGYASTGYNYLISWLGAVDESSDPFNPRSTISSVLHSIVHVQNVLFLQRSSYTDNEGIKKAIMKYGGVQTQLYMTGNMYQYYTGNNSANHAVCIVGWNDSLTFANAPGKGGWIIKNSWGPDRLDNGYFYVSYYDKTCVPVGRIDNTYTIILNDTIRFDKNYQYDIPGRTDFFANSSSTVWYKNIFNSTDNEYLAAVSTHFEKDTDWELEIYVNNQLRHSQSGRSNPGYYTIELNDFILLNEGDIFEVIFKITVDGEAAFPISEKISLNKLFYGPNLSYLSYDGENWVDLYDLKWTYSSHTYNSQVACIKAFTFLNPINTSIDIIVDKTYNPCLIKAIVLNQYGHPVLHGNVTLNVEGQDYIVNIVNGIASLNHAFSSMGNNSIKASFERLGFNSSSSEINVKVYNESLEINLDIIVGIVDAEININLSKSINQTVYLVINQSSYDVDVKNGVGKLTLTDLDYGIYNLTAFIISDYYYCENVTDSYNITHITTFIDSADYEGYCGDNIFYSVHLFDKNHIPIIGKAINVIVDGKTYENVTDDGVALFNLKLGLGNYKIEIICPEDEKYLKSEANQIIIVKTTISLPSVLNYTYNSDYIVNFLDSNGNNLNNQEVLISINNKEYTLKTDAEGKLNYAIKLSPGSYEISIKNLVTSEVKTQNIKVVKRITENKAVVMYYGAGKYYKVKVFDDNGNVAKGVKVTFTINNKKYTRTTDNNGYASFKISQKPAKYTITAEYKGFKVSNRILVKSTIVAKDITVKYGKTVKFAVKLLNKNGKILKNKKVTFKFKGKTYKVKTGSNGKAILKIAKIYKKGTYTISSKYGTLAIKKKIRIV